MSQPEQPQPREKIVDPWCASCIGACCTKNTVLYLTRREAIKLAQNTDMREMGDDELQAIGRPPFHTKYYVLNDACGNRNPETMECDIYDDRPKVCREFDAGSIACQQFRVARGVDNSIMLGMPVMPSQRQ